MRSWRRFLAGRSVRATGFPTSSNRASSFHLRWDWGLSAPPMVEVAAVLTVLERPSTEHLHFWALQASFSGGGAGHVGLQHHAGHPGRTAANWGGYAPGGRGELQGSESPLPSARGNPNTRDFAWAPGVGYRLTIRRGARGWAGLVDDVVLRELYAEGDRLSGVVVWSEVFARCDDPSTAVRWSDLTGITAAGETVHPRAVHVNYQTVGAGGCSNTSSDLDGDGGIVQRTNSVRTTRQGAVLGLG